MRISKTLITAGFLLLPVLSLFAENPIHTGPNLDSDCAIAYNSTDDEYMVVWNKGGANLITGVYAQRLDKSGTPIGNPVLVSQSSSRPALAYNPQKNEYLVVFETIIVFTGQVIYGIRLDAAGSLITGSGGILMSQAGYPEIVYNALDDSYLLVGAWLYDNGFAGLCNAKFYTGKISSTGQPVGTARLIRDQGHGLCTDGARYSVAYAPVTSTETPQGRYLLVIDTPADLTMLDHNGAIVSKVIDSQSGAIVDDHVPFQQSKIGIAYNVDVAYGNWQGEPAFMIVWGDRDQQVNNQEWTGIWAGIVNATPVEFDANAGVANTVFPVSRIWFHRATPDYAKSWKPVVAYNQIADKFMVAWRETPTTDPNNVTKVNHIRANAVNSPAIPPPANVVLSAVTGNEDPKNPAIAASAKSADALVAWQDARNSATSGIDIYGSLYATTPVQPELTVASPNGGELWHPGSSYNITWTSQGLSDPVRIEYSTDGGMSYKTIVSSTPNDGGHPWTVPNEPSANCLVRVSDAADGNPLDVSDAKFAIGYRTFVVTNTNDNGAGSLRQAIIDANSNAGTDTIYFNIPGSTKHTILPGSPLPAITDPVVIDGYSQPGASPNTNAIDAGSNTILMIELNGSNTGASAHGLHITAGNSTVRGLVVNSFDGAGIELETNGGNTIAGNFIGTDVTGTGGKGNTHGLIISRCANNVIGGTTASARNVISDNKYGIGIYGLRANGNDVQGNFIGTDVSGNVSLNNEDGIYITSNNNTIGGTTAAARNVISGNKYFGIRLNGDSNVVQGNFIGTNLTGTSAIGNIDGIVINGSDNTIGGVVSGAGNVISGNSTLGINIDDSGAGNAIRSNSIFSNGGRGIDLNDDGVTANDPGDSDTGPNNLQNFPVLTSAASAGGSTIIQGTLNSTTNASFTLEFFSNETCDPSGYGEGQTMLGSTGVTTDAAGNASFNVTFPVSVPQGDVVTATATDANNNTSEFSQCLAVSAANTQTGTNVTVNPGNGVQLTFDNVDGAGNTSATTSNSGTPPPGGFTVIPVSSPTYYSITTTASYSGNIKICIQYSDANMTLAQEKALKFYVYESSPGQWKDITTSLDINANVICGAVNHLSEFAVMIGAVHFTFRSNTGDSYSIVINNATLDGNSLDNGDEIGVFAPDGLCVGASVWSGSLPLALTAWADDSQTDEVDGYIAGETMSFRVWQQSSDQEFPATASYTQGNGSFGNNVYAELALSANSESESGGIVVENTNSSGPGSLADAISQANANAGPDTITFAVPESDPGYHDVAGTWTIELTEALPAISGDSLFIDGGAQAAFVGRDANPDGPEIVLNGSQIGSGSGFFITSSGNRIEHLVINGFDAGVYISGERAQFNSVSGCYIGTDATGTQAAPNNSAFYIYSANNTIGGNEAGARNILSGNRVFGVLISDEQANNNRIIGNFIGTDASGTNDLGNGRAGIMVQINPSGNEITGNLISGNDQDGIRMTGTSNKVTGNLIGTDVTGSAIIGNGWAGISIWGGGNHSIGGVEAGAGNTISGNNQGGILLTSASANNHVIGNFIGTNANGAEALGNVNSGVRITGKAQSNTIGPENLIAFNQYIGVSVSSDSTLFNTITQNSIWSNSDAAIDNSDGGNAGIQPPSISSVNDGVVTGTAPANATVEIFSDEKDEGRYYEGTAVADNSGNFAWNGTPSGPFVTATATDASGNTSEFALAQDVTAVDEINETTVPTEFALHQNYPNPFNPTTSITFSLPRQARVRLQIFDLIGREIARPVDSLKPAGFYSIVFEASDLPSGVYFYKLQVTEAGQAVFTRTKKLTLIK